MRDSVIKMGVVHAALNLFANLLIGESVPRNAAILCVRKTEDEHEQPVQQEKTDGESNALSERLGGLVVGQEEENNRCDCKQRPEKAVHKQPTEEGQHQRHKEKPAVAPADFMQ